jgi:arginine/lysine/ornithine decarboxylase
MQVQRASSLRQKGSDMAIRHPAIVQHSHPDLQVCWGPATNRSAHVRAPLLDALSATRKSNQASFSAPGHKRGAGADAALVELLGVDVFACDAWLNAALFAKTVRAAEALAADAWGAERAFYLVNGSSSGNHAFLLASLGPGDEVIVARDIHTSLLTGLILTGARPVYVTPRFHPDAGVSLGVAPADVADALDAHPGARLVVLGSPSYYGIAADLPGVVGAAHARGVPVYVDETWGPHFRFHPALPPSAMQCGADAAVTSAHKLLGSLSQASLLLLQGSRMDYERVAATVAITQTSSPFLPILASIDSARRQMALDGEALLGRAIALASDARDRLLRLPGVDVLGGRRLGIDAFDPTRLVIDVHGLGLTGYCAERTLRGRFGIVPEMSDRVSVVCLITIGDGRESIDRLVAAFAALSTENWTDRRAGSAAMTRALGSIVAAGPQLLSPREAFFARARALPLAMSGGEIAAELVVPYPPGVPVIAPGELITPDKITYLQDEIARGMCVRGASDPTLTTVRVVA